MADVELPQAPASATIRSCYVYRIDDCAGVPLYVGKGGGRRDRHWQKRNAGIAALIEAGLPWNPIRVAAGLTEAEALAEEKRLIALYGRWDLGLGPLENLTDGGAGAKNPSRKHRDAIVATLRARLADPEARARFLAILKDPGVREKIAASHRGLKRSAETRAKMSAAAKLRKPMSAETRDKIASAHRGKTLSPEHVARAVEGRRQLYANRKVGRLAVIAKRAEPRASDSEKPLSQ
jgi:hypothetical protein